MLRTPARALAVAWLLAIAPAALAQAPGGRPSPSIRVGFGVGVEPLYNGTLVHGVSVPAVGIYLPIQIGSLRIEPSLAMATFSQGTAAARTSGPISSSTLVLGAAGHFYVVPPSPVGIYAGGRLSLAFESTRDLVPGAAQPTIARTSAASITLAGVLGGEYLVQGAFSVGAEVQLGVTALGDLEVETSGVVTRLARDGALATNGVVYLRYLF